MPRIGKTICTFLPAGAWYAVIFRFSAQTGTSSGSMSNGLAYWLLERVYPAFFRLSEAEQADAMETITFVLRKSAHMSIYFILAALLLWPVSRLTKSPVRRTGAVLTLSGLLAALDEFHQTFVPGRTGKPTDVMIDLAGAGIFLLLWAAASRIWNSRRS